MVFGLLIMKALHYLPNISWEGLPTCGELNYIFSVLRSKVKLGFWAITHECFEMYFQYLIGRLFLRWQRFWAMKVKGQGHSRPFCFLYFGFRALNFAWTSIINVRDRLLTCAMSPRTCSSTLYKFPIFIEILHVRGDIAHVRSVKQPPGGHILNQNDPNFNRYLPWPMPYVRIKF